MRVFVCVRVHADASQRHVRCMCMRAQSQASVCSPQKHSFFFIFREAALKDKVSGQVSSAGQPDASLSQALSRPRHSTPPPLYHHYHPTLSSAALSHSCSGNSCPVLSPAVLWDQMQSSHHTFPKKQQQTHTKKKKLLSTMDSCLTSFKITCYTITQRTLERKLC